jgi:hypothetical protein
VTHSDGRFYFVMHVRVMETESMCAKIEHVSQHCAIKCLVYANKQSLWHASWGRNIAIICSVSGGGRVFEKHGMPSGRGNECFFAAGVKPYNEWCVRWLLAVPMWSVKNWKVAHLRNDEFWVVPLLRPKPHSAWVNGYKLLSDPKPYTVPYRKQ